MLFLYIKSSRFVYLLCYKSTRVTSQSISSLKLFPSDFNPPWSGTPFTNGDQSMDKKLHSSFSLVCNYSSMPLLQCLTHWGRVTHICVSKLTIICSDNGLSPGRRQAIIWTNAGILLIRTLGTNFSEIAIKIQTFSLKKMRLKMSSAK